MKIFSLPSVIVAVHSNYFRNMAMREIHDELTSLLSCNICFEEFKDRNPRQLNCLHVFCEPCLQNMLDGIGANNPTNPHSICCPICKQTTPVTGGLVTNLPAFFHISRVLDIRNKIEKHNQICHTCISDVPQATISSYCFDCSCGHYETCRVSHDKIFENHGRMPVTPSIVDYFLCEVHGVHLGHFCMTCTKSVCSQCYVGKHCDHKVYDLTYGKEKVQDDVKESFLSGLASADEMLQNLTKLESRLSNDIKQTMEEMTHQRDHLLQLIEARYANLCQELQKNEIQMKHSLSDSKQLIEDARNFFKGMLAKADSLMEPVEGMPEAQIRDFAQLMADIKQQMPSINNANIRLKTVKFVIGDNDVTLGELVEDSKLISYYITMFV